MNKFEAISDKKPVNVIADAAFGSEQNYAYLERFAIGNYLKFSTFHQEQTKKFKENIFHKDNFNYDKNTDSFKCPDNRDLGYKASSFVKNKNGTVSYVRMYGSNNCDNCLLAEKCKKGQLRSIQVNRRLERYKQQARENLTSEKGQKLRKLRNIEVETVFGDIKWNYGFRRFLLRGIEKVNIEMGLLSLAHNFRKLYKLALKGSAFTFFYLVYPYRKTYLTIS